MKRIFLSIFALCCLAMTASATKVYINPGHGSWGSNCRPMATINYAAGDTLGFFESNTNLWKAFMLETKLKSAGFSVKMSRRASGGSGTNEYNKALSTICSEAENYGADYYISIHSNAGPEGELNGGYGKFANYPVILYRGYTGSPKVANSDKMAKASVKRLYEAFWNKPAKDGATASTAGGGPEFTTYYSPSNPDVIGDLSFYDTSSTYGYLGALKHNIPGFLSEGYFHTYSPARHRALSPEWCRQEGVRYFRGIMDYYGKAGESVGYIMGYVRSKTETFSHKYYIPYKNSNDVYKPINGAKIVLRNAANEVIKTNCYNYVKRMLKNQDYYTTDHNYNGVFVFENLAPGKYTVSVHANGYKDYTGTVTVTADKTTYPEIFLEKGQGTDPNINADIKWVLNGGIIPGGDVPSNADLWEAFKPYYNSYYGLNRADQTIENVATFASAYMQDIMTNTKSEYKWLGDYIVSVAGALDGESAWRWHVHAFFNCNDGTVAGNQKIATADFSQAGKPAAWGEAYQIAMGTSATLPSSVKETYVIPTPKKDGDVFVGWYNNPRGQGTPITSIPAGYKGTIYAIWQNENPDSDKEINIITWVLNGGIVPSGDVPSNEQLIASFKDGYNTYFSQSIATTRELSNFLYYGNSQGCDVSKMLTDEKSGWKWLGDYLLSVAGSLDSESAWRWHLFAFFNCNDGTVTDTQKVATADFTQAGKPEAWGTAYQIAMGITGELPTTVSKEFELPIPVKEGYVFIGWFDNPEGTGTAITSIPAGWYGTLYAIWKAKTATNLEELYSPSNVQKILHNGQILIMRDGKVYNMMGQIVEN